MGLQRGKRGRLKLTWVQLWHHQHYGDTISSLPVAGVALVRARSNDLEHWHLEWGLGGSGDLGSFLVLGT